MPVFLWYKGRLVATAVVYDCSEQKHQQFGVFRLPARMRAFQACETGAAPVRPTKQMKKERDEAKFIRDLKAIHGQDWEKEYKAILEIESRNSTVAVQYFGKVKV